MKSLIYLPTKKNIKEGIHVIGVYADKYSLMMIVITLLVAAMGVFFSIYWQFDETSDGTSSNDLIHLFTHIGLAVVSAGLAGILILRRFKKVSPLVLAVSTQVYAALLMAYGAIVGCLDLYVGDSPLSYLLLASAVAGLFVVGPMIYFVSLALCLSAIFICQGIYHFPFFSGPYAVETIVNFILFGIVSLLTCYRSYRVMMKENQAQEALERLTYFDDLTGLFNERSYVLLTEEINKSIEEGTEKPFAIVMMDVNRLKATNDQYGHRFGCSLVVHAGKVLPTLFPTSRLFHVGGDEFIAFVEGEDYEHLEERIQTFDEQCENTLYEYDGVKLIFSIARGYSSYQGNEQFRDVLQRADEAMYINKKAIKEKFGWKGG